MLECACLGNSTSAKSGRISRPNTGKRYRIGSGKVGPYNTSTSLNCSFTVLSVPYHSLLSLAGRSLPAAMSAQNTYPANQVHSPYLQTQPAATQEDFKASYDDLIDDYSEPYAANARHQTFTVGTPNQTHHRGPSIPLSSKSVFTSKQSDDTHETSYGYPPAVPPKEIDTRSFWQKVSINSIHFFSRVLNTR